jgi:hypothetical protein
MLDLDSPEWSSLEHAYGAATDTPALLKQLDELPECADWQEEPWFTLWSSLAHQGDVYSASFAAVPHVIRAIKRSPERASAQYLTFPAWVEICRAKKGLAVPEPLVESYKRALSEIPSVVAEAARSKWPNDKLRSALAAIAAANGDVVIAEAILELTPDVAAEFLARQESE